MKRKLYHFKISLIVCIFLMKETFCAPFFIADQCTNICKDANLPSLGLFNYEQIICQRGCRLFNIIKLKEDMRTNAIKNKCYEFCEEYIYSKEKEICKTGCNLMANEQGKNVQTFLVEEESSIVLSNPEKEIEFDLLSDPSIKSQLEIGFNIDYKIPETRIRTMPIKMAEITVEEEVKVPSGDWLDCAARNSGIPRWILLIAILSAVLIALWLSFTTDKKTAREISSENMGNLSDDKLISRDHEILEKDPVLMQLPNYYPENITFVPLPPYKEEITTNSLQV